ncbi:Cytochrome b-c1 complex subunit 7 [Ophidiomyces ophidiicola]|nr:Cytochrome b-c1 complex subunit 7 [Ophidiomyces ophidiicola]
MSLAAIVNRTFEVPWVKRMMMPFAQWYTGAAGYRQMGLSGILLALHASRLTDCVRAVLDRYDDLIPEENDVVQTALKRLPPKEAYDRIYRLRRAFQVRCIHEIPEIRCVRGRQQGYQDIIGLMGVIYPTALFATANTACERANQSKGGEQTRFPKQVWSCGRLLTLYLTMQDIRYLQPLIDEVERERKERDDLDSLVLKR